MTREELVALRKEADIKWATSVSICPVEDVISHLPALGRICLYNDWGLVGLRRFWRAWQHWLYRPTPN